MLLSRKLARIHNNVDALKSEISAQEAIGISNLAQRRIIERCVMQLQLEMELFIRNYILDCATGKYKTSTGSVASTLAQEFENREAAHHYLSRVRRQAREPQWAIPTQAISAANTLGLTNYAHISAELGITPWEIDNLRYVRNFIAHRSKESAIKLRVTGLTSSKNPIDPVAIIIGPSPLGGKSYERWAGFIKGVASRLVN